MRKFFTLILVVSGIHSFAQITWSAPVTVTSAGSGHNLHPRIALNRAGNPYILWGQTDTRAYLSKWNGTAFTTPVVPSGSLTIFSQTWAGPMLAAYGDTVYVSMQLTPECVSSAYAYLAHSYDGGATFSPPVRVSNIDTSNSRFPVVTTTASGNPLVAFMKFNASCNNPHYVVSRSSDYGASFSSDVLASGASGKVCECCPSAILTTGTNTVVELFRNNLGNIRDMWAGVSTDGGMTFPTDMAVDNTNWNISSCPASGPDGIIIGDTIYSVFMSGASGMSLAYLSRSSMSTTLSSTTAITGSFSGLTSQNYPRIANSGVAAAAVWVQNTTSGNGIVYAFTNNISSGFAGYSSLAGATGSGIQNADVALAPGVVHVVWEDDNTGKVMYVKGTYTTTSIPAAEASHIELFPNPATGDFSFSLPGTATIASCHLADIYGRRIQLTPTVNKGTALCSLKGIAAGAYFFVVLDNAGKTYSGKLVVQ